MRIAQLWNRIVNLGNSSSYDLREQARIRLVNKLGFVAMIVIVALFLVRYFTSPQSIYGSFTSFTFVSLILYLNLIRQHLFSRIIACFFFPMTIMYIVMNEGATMGEFIIYLLNVVLAYILFEDNKKMRNVCVVWIAIIATLSFYHVSYTFESNPIASHMLGSIGLFFAAIVMLCYMISFYQSELEENRNHKDQLLSNLKRKNIELERFAFISSHDLKEPAKTIIAFSELSASYLKQKEYDKVAEFIQVINKSGRHMNQLIEDTLEFASYDNGENALVVVDLEIVLKEVKKLLSKEIIEKRAVIISYQNLPKVLGLEQQLVSCFKNLIENAISYNDSRDPIVEIDCKLKNGEYTITFKDNGVGIKSEFHDKIFQMYERLVNRNQKEGTGLGLPITKKVVEKLGGKIWVASELGKGSTFFITLPYFSDQNINKEIKVLEPIT